MPTIAKEQAVVRHFAGKRCILDLYTRFVGRKPYRDERWLQMTIRPDGTISRV